MTSTIADHRRGRRSPLAPMAAFALASAAASVSMAQLTSAWTSPLDGNWTDNLRWSTPNYPNNGPPGGSTYTAILSFQPSAYTVSLADPISVSTLTIASTNATLALSGGTLSVLNRLSSAGNITQTGGALNVSSTFTSPADVHGNGSYVHSGGTLNFGSFLEIGAVIADKANYALSGNGYVAGETMYVGVNFGEGSFTQSGGTVNLTTLLDLSDGTISCHGVYTLNGGTLTAPLEFIGAASSGAFIQNDGYNIVPDGGNNNLGIGEDEDSSGTYQLNGGTLQAANMVVGHFGAGSLAQTGGTSTVSGVLRVGRDVGGTGYYALSGNATLSVNGEVNAGKAGAGTFDQSGGQFTLNAPLYVGKDAGGVGLFKLSAGTLAVHSNESIGNSGTGTFNQLGGVHSISGALTLSANAGGRGTFLLSGGTLSAASVVNNGTILATAGVGSFGNVTGTGTIGASSFGSLSVAMLRTGAVSLSGDAQITVRQNGAPANVSRVSILTVAGGAAPTARLDLVDNDLIVTAGDRDTIGQLVRSARHGNAWDAGGLTSSAARDNAQHNTTLGVMSGLEYKSLGTTSFDTFAVANTDVLIKYTYYGDANFNGKIDGADYSHIDTTFNQEHTAGNIGGWINGDFNYDGKVDGADYGLIDGAFNSQSATLARAIAYAQGTDPDRSTMTDPALALIVQHLDQFGDDYRVSFLSTVPEPASVEFIAATASLALLSRRRKC